MWQFSFTTCVSLSLSRKPEAQFVPDGCIWFRYPLWIAIAKATPKRILLIKYSHFEKVMRKHGLNTWLFSAKQIYYSGLLHKVYIHCLCHTSARARARARARGIETIERKDSKIYYYLFPCEMQHEWNLKSTVCVNANGIWLVFIFIDFSISLNDAIFFVSLAFFSMPFSTWALWCVPLNQKFTPHKTYLSYMTRKRVS